MKKSLLLFLFLFGFLPQAHAEIKSKVITYRYNNTTMKGYLAWDDATHNKRPGILVVHEFWGLNDYARKRAEQLAGMGYVAFAADMYGNGKVAKHPEEAMGMMNAVRENKVTWLGRGNAALDVLKKQSEVDANHLAAIGYCFGGATVLQLAYAGADLDAVASFHGALPIPESTKDIKSKILILHGADDPFVSAETAKQLKSILKKGKIDFRWVSYPHTVHGFTVLNSEKIGMKGVAYNAKADQLSWQEMTKLFQKVFR